MIKKDDRTTEQKKTHTYLVGGTDSFLSGWGMAKNGNSYAFWACKPKDYSKVLNWVEKRGDIKRVRLVFDPYYPNPDYCKHCHIYFVDEKHPAIN